ncbi:MAG: tetratricopeptide repeat protein [Chloroflexota bacterium]
MRPLLPSVNRPLAEALAAAVLLAVIGVAGARAARAYDLFVRPLARSVPTATPTPVVDPQVIRENARRLRLALDHVGAGIALRQANPRAAVEEFMRALEIDPGNLEARQNLIEMGTQTPR